MLNQLKGGAVIIEQLKVFWQSVIRMRKVANPATIDPFKPIFEIGCTGSSAYHFIKKKKYEINTILSLDCSVNVCLIRK